MSQEALATSANTSAQQIDRLEKGQRKLSLEWIERLAPALGVEPLEIIYEGIKSNDARRVPLVGAISCGDWAEAVGSAEETVVTFAGGPKSFALRPAGDSMNKLVDEDGYVVVDPEQIELIDGKCYAVMNGDGETTAKRFKASPARLVPCSTNPSHREIMVGQSQFLVIGRIVFAGREL